MLQEIKSRKPFGNLSRNISKTPQQVIPPEESLLDVNPEDIYWMNTIKPISLEFDFKSENYSQEIEPRWIPFNIYSENSIQEEEKEQEILPKINRFPSFEGFQLDNSELEDKLYSQENSFHL